MLHVMLARYINDQENYGVYKEVIKQLLQLSHSRDVKNNLKLTPAGLLDKY